MSDNIEDLERAKKREALFLCKRCGETGHAMDTCMQESMPLNDDGHPMPVDPNDVFIHSKVDRRIIDRLATEMWQLALSYLHVRDVIPHVPRVCKYLGREVVWGNRLLWLEMAPGAEGLDARVFKRRSWENAPSATALTRACDRGAPIAHVSALLAGGANVNAVCSYGQTALLCASNWGHEDIVRALLGANADPNIADSCGWTSLIAASLWGHSAVVSLLIAAGANVNHAVTMVGPR